MVNSVTYTDPTHITLDLDTTAATNGAVSVTVTNPDGQTSTCTPLVVGTDTDAPPAAESAGNHAELPGDRDQPDGSSARTASAVPA